MTGFIFLVTSVCLYQREFQQQVDWNRVCRTGANQPIENLNQNQEIFIDTDEYVYKYIYILTNY